MDLIRSVGVVIPAHTRDPAGDARRLEALGFSHAVLPHHSTTPTVLALGATRRLRMHAAVEVVEQLRADSELPSGCVERLEALGASGNGPLAVDPDDAESAYAAISRAAEESGRVTVTILGPHAPGVRKLALDALSRGAPGRPSHVLYAEDLTVGQRFHLGDYELTADEIVSFAERFDPLDFHLDPALAAASPIGVLCASGMHTQSIMQRLNARGFHRSVAVVAGRGSLGMRLPRPATPGLRLHGATEILDVRMRPNGRAVVTIRSTLHANDELVLEQTGELIVQQAAANHLSVGEK